MNDNEINDIRAILLDLESKEERILELVGAFIAGLPISEDKKYILWAEWVSFTTEDDLDDYYEAAKSLPVVTLEDITAEALEAVESVITDTDQSLQSFEITEVNFTTPKAVAKQFLSMYNKPLKYVADLDIWLQWSLTHWTPVQEVYLMNVLANATDRIFKRHKKIDEYGSTELKAFSRTYNKVSGLKEVLKTVKAQNEIEILSKNLDNDKNIIGCVNGAVDLTTGKLVVSNYEDYLTKSTNLIYNRNANCDVWQQTINDVFSNDAEMISFFKTLMGYAILGHNKQHLFCFFIGSGANGKSTVVNALSSALGDYSKSTAFSTLTVSSKGAQHREDLVRLQGALMVHTSEPNVDGDLNEAMLKDISGGDAVVARTAYARKSVEIAPRWLTIVPTNHMPRIKSNDNGIWRRMLFVPFERNFRLEPELLDLDLPEKLAAEKEGILRWIIEGALDYNANGLVIPERIRRNTEDYRQEMDIVRTWIETECLLEGSDSNQNLWASFSSFVRARGYETDIKSSQKLSNNLYSRSFERARFNNGVRGFNGIKVRG